MKTMLKVLIIAIMPLFVLTADLPFLMVDLVPDAHAIFGVRRRALRRGVIIGEAAATSTNAAVTPSPPGATLPMGTVVHTLPADCPAKAIGGVEYYNCGGNYYRTAFQGSNLVYVTANPK